MPIVSFSICPLSVRNLECFGQSKRKRRTTRANRGRSGSRRYRRQLHVRQRGRKVSHRGPVRASGPLQPGAGCLPAADRRRPCRSPSDKAGVALSDIVAVGLDTPGPASALRRPQRARLHQLRASRLGRIRYPHEPGRPVSAKPVTYLNDGNAGALWGHFTLFGGDSRETSLSAIIGTGLGGGVIVDGNVVKGSKGFGGELGHVLIPYQSIIGIQGLEPECNCGRTGDLESLCSLTAIEQDRSCRTSWPAIPATIWAKLRPAQGRQTGARHGRERRPHVPSISSAYRPMRSASSSMKW